MRVPGDEDFCLLESTVGGNRSRGGGEPVGAHSENKGESAIDLKTSQAKKKCK
jgi:hypothetical protein